MPVAPHRAIMGRSRHRGMRTLANGATSSRATAAITIRRNDSACTPRPSTPTRMAGKAEAHRMTVPVRARKREDIGLGCMRSSMLARNEKFHLAFVAESVSTAYARSGSLLLIATHRRPRARPGRERDAGPGSRRPGVAIRPLQAFPVCLGGSGGPGRRD
jgi:hypothetical protein